MKKMEHRLGKTSKEKVLESLDLVIETIEEMKECMDDTEPDSPQAFFEAGMYAQEIINSALQEALSPLLNFRKTAKVI